MAFQVGNTIFAHADGSVRLIPREGPRAGQPFTVRAASKIATDLNAKVVEAKGNSIEMVALCLGEASPSFSIGLDVLQVAVDYVEHCGNGAARMAHDAVVSFVRPGLQPVTFKLSTCLFEKGFGVASDAGSQAKSELSGKMRRMVLSYGGKEYDYFALPGAQVL